MAVEISLLCWPCKSTSLWMLDQLSQCVGFTVNYLLWYYEVQGSVQTESRATKFFKDGTGS